MHFSKPLLATSVLLAGKVLAIELNLEDASSIRGAAKTIAASVIDRYHKGFDIPGLFGDPYYFWEGGLAWDSLIHYWHQTGDESYNDLVGEALRWQVGSENNYMPTNQTRSEGNDDQSTWALAAMTAAEYGFPTDALDGLNTTWLDLAVTVFESQAARWEDDSCKGGLRWQIFAFNNGYNYKNSLANGNFYQLAYRLARFTGDDKYADWGARVRDWSFETGLVANASSSDAGTVFDGTDLANNCTQMNTLVWTANAGTYLAGSAFAYNHTASLANNDYQTYVPVINETFASGLHGSTNGTITEVACAPRNNCNTDSLAYRAILARALAQTRALTDETPLWTSDSQLNGPSAQNISSSQGNGTRAWSIHERIDFMLQTSAKGAAAQCSGGDKGTTCGSDWASSEWDGTEGLGQDLSALNIILANIPITGELATVNSSATEVGGSSAAGGNGTEADGAPASEGAASSFALSTMGLTVTAGGMILLLL